MESSLIEKINKLNEYNHKVELGNELNPGELNDQKILRDEIINYFKFAITKIKK